MRKYLIVILLCIGCNLATALQKIFVFHINGIGTTQGQATANKIALESSVMIQSNDIANNGHFDLLYNSDESTAFCGLCNQLMDVFRQKKYENLSNEEFIEAYMKDYNLNYPKDSPEYKQLESTIQEKYFGDSRFVGANFW